MSIESTYPCFNNAQANPRSGFQERASPRHLCAAGDATARPCNDSSVAAVQVDQDR